MNLEHLIKKAYLDAGCDPAWVDLNFSMADKLYPNTTSLFVPNEHVPHMLREMIATIHSGRPLSDYLFTPEGQRFMEAQERLN